MSFKVEGKTSLVVDRKILEKVAKKYGWTVEHNTTIRSHDIASGKNFDVVLRNPKTDDHRCYDVGVTYAKDGKTAEFIFDKWGESVEKQLGVNCGKFKQECAVAAIHENDYEHAHLDYEEYYNKFCHRDSSGALIYNGYDDEEWEESDKDKVKEDA